MRQPTIYQPTDEEMEDPIVERYAPISTSSRPQPTNYVPALPARRPEPSLPAGWAEPVTSGDMEIWRPSGAIQERTDAKDRAVGLLIRQLPMWVIWAILAVAAGLTAHSVAALSGLWSTIFGLAIFGGAAAASFLAMNQAELSHSGAGLERHRINQAAGLKRMELKQAHELKRMALESYLDLLERREDRQP